MAHPSFHGSVTQCFICFSALIVEMNAQVSFTILEYFPPHKSLYHIKEGERSALVLSLHFYVYDNVSDVVYISGAHYINRIGISISTSSAPKKLGFTASRHLKMNAMNFAFKCEMSDDSVVYFSEVRRAATDRYLPNDGRIFFSREKYYDLSTENGCRLKFKLESKCPKSRNWDSDCGKDCEPAAKETCDWTTGLVVCNKTYQGFRGKNCIEDINECETRDVCKNQGHCINTRGSFLCECTDRFQGKICDEDVDECLTNPCQNGGFCVNHYGGYQCGCPSGFGGERCEYKSECSFFPCQNNGICEMENEKPRCLCTSKFAGDYCEQLYEEADVSPDSMVGTILLAVFSILIFGTGTGYYLFLQMKKQEETAEN